MVTKSESYPVRLDIDYPEKPSLMSLAAFASGGAMAREPSNSTLHPDGWIGDKAELHRARRYRALIRWAQIPLWASFLASGFIPFLADMVLTGFLFAGFAGEFVYQKRISLAIGRKWTFSKELREVWRNRTSRRHVSANGLSR